MGNRKVTDLVSDAQCRGKLDSIKRCDFSHILVCKVDDQYDLVIGSFNLRIDN